MKKIICLLVAGAMALMLAGCGGDAAVEELDKNDTEKAEAKTVNASSKEEKPEKEAKEKDIWTYYNDAKWSDDYNGLKMEIQKAVVTDKAPTMED
jgi:ABC-type glycerol-3-phosphate transport system substrate-binding protein